MTIDLTIALRYLRPRRFSFIGLIGVLSGLGIIIGTSTLIIVMSLFNGFRDVAHDLMTSFGPHLRVTARAGAEVDGAMRGWSPIWRTSLVVQAPQGTSVVQGLGIEASDTSTRAALKGALVGGSFDVAVRNGLPCAVVSSGVAQSLNLYLGDTLRVISPRQIESALTMMTMPLGIPVLVVGVFQSNASREVDASTVYLPSDMMSTLLGSMHPTEWHVRVPKPEQADQIASELAASLGNSARVETWQQINSGVYETMRLERLGSFVVLMLIIVVAGFSILVSLTMGVVEKRHDIAMLKTMGLRNSMIARIYVWQGLLIGVISAGIGTAVGLILCFGQLKYQWIRFDMTEGYLIPALPLHVQTADVIIIALSAVVVSSIAAIYPAMRAAALELISSHTR